MGGGFGGCVEAARGPRAGRAPPSRAPRFSGTDFSHQRTASAQLLRPPLWFPGADGRSPGTRCLAGGGGVFLRATPTSPLANPGELCPAAERPGGGGPGPSAQALPTGGSQTCRRPPRAGWSTSVAPEATIPTDHVLPRGSRPRNSPARRCWDPSRPPSRISSRYAFEVGRKQRSVRDTRAAGAPRSRAPPAPFPCRVVAPPRGPSCHGLRAHPFVRPRSTEATGAGGPGRGHGPRDGGRSGCGETV